MQKGIRKGREEGIIEGIKRGLKEALLSDIQTKFRKTPTSIKKEIMRIDDVDRLRLLKKEVIKSKTLKEFEKKLKSLDNSR
ncbi:MAG: hypothetical protein RMJ45_07960, partial [Candidatus Calescibacterium sp.]|nr:hypothetical protein [Candidatus Calescibacterium sp.]